MAEANITVTINVNAAEFEELVRDAKRYRHLRKWHWYNSKYAVVMNPKREVLPGAYCPFEDQLDQVVDEEMKREQQVERGS